MVHKFLMNLFRHIKMVVLFSFADQAFPSHAGYPISAVW